MGMYDTIWIDNVTCPLCNQVNQEMDLQTKDLDCCSDKYNFPDILSVKVGPSHNIQDYSDESKIKPEMTIFAYGSCMHCKQFFAGELYIKDYILHGYRFVNKSTQQVSERIIPIFPELGNILQTKNQLTTDLRHSQECFRGVLLALMNGERIDEELAAKIDQDQGVGTLKYYHRFVGLIIDGSENFFSQAGEVYRTILKWNKNKK